jgi:hypothetical protein
MYARRYVSLIPRTTLHSDSEQRVSTYIYFLQSYLVRKCGLFCIISALVMVFISDKSPFYNCKSPPPSQV